MRRHSLLRVILTASVSLQLIACSNKPTINPDNALHETAQANDPILSPNAINIRSVSRRAVSPLQPIKTRRSYGTILIREKTQEDARTKVILNSCTHPQSGTVKCNTYLYPIDPEGDLVTPAIALQPGINQGIMLAEGSYYMKASNANSDYLVSGEVHIKPKVTNYIRLVFE